MTEQELREIVVATGKRMLADGLVQGTWGNISIRLDEHRMIVTPSGRDYERLTADELVIVDIDTLEYDSPIKPTSEKKIHAAIYRDRPDIGAVIHSHPWNGCAVASTRREMPITTPEARELIGETARTGKYGLPGTKKLTKGTVEAMKDRNACFMANHGILCAGKDMETAFATCAALEREAGIYLGVED